VTDKSEFVSLQNLNASCFPWITHDRAERYKWRWSGGNNLDVCQKTGLTELLGNHDGNLIRHLSSSLQPISWARLESILRLSCPHSQMHAPWNMMDEGSTHTSLILSTEYDSIYTYSITGECCQAGGSQSCPLPDQLCEQMQTDVGHILLHFRSCSQHWC